MKTLARTLIPASLLFASASTAQLTPRYTLAAPAAALASYPDIDGDGVRELLIGVPSSTASTGVVQVRSGASGALLRTIAGPAAAGASSSFGQSLSAGGDVNGDGVVDILVGDPYAGPNGLAFLFSPRGYNLLTGGTGFRLIGTFTPTFISGGACSGQSVQYGASVAILGDLTGDGLSELGIGAPAFSFGPLVCAGTGYVNVISPALVFPTALPPAVVAGPASFTLFPPLTVNNKRFGQTLTAMGDVSGDGVGEVVISAPRVPNPFLGGSTDVMVYDGAALMAGGIVPFALQTDINDFGFALAAIPDIDGNAVGELVIGTANTLNDSTPCVSLVTGKNLSRAAAIVPPAMVAVQMRTMTTNPSPGNRTGHALASVADFNGDGVSDLLVGAPAANGPSGEALIVDPRNFAVLAKASPTVASTHFGRLVASLETDAFGSPLFAVADTGSGTVSVF